MDIAALISPDRPDAAVPYCQSYEALRPAVVVPASSQG